jgi:dihydrofolate reductase
MTSATVGSLYGMQKLKFQITISLDGYVAGPRQSLENPLGEGAIDLHAWVVATRSWRQQHGVEGGETGVDDDHAARSMANVGATIMGRNMFGPVRGPWDEEWNGWWGDEPPFHHPVFVLTHHPREPLVLGETTFHFVTDGADAALEQARAAADGKDVAIGGGADTVRQYLWAGAVDEFELHVAPLLLGSGERLFEGVDLAGRYVCDELESSSRAAHFVYRRA